MTAGLIIKSILMGMDHALTKRDFAALEIESLPFKAAVEYMTKRMPLSKEEYYKKDNQAKFRAFTVSRIADGAILEKVKNILTENLKEKTGFSTFLKQTDSQILDAVGMGPGKAWYWETVYRTNVQTAYNVGRAIGFDATKPLALEFVGLEDGRQTDICRHLSEAKIVLPYGDPFWDTHTPPLHFGCRSTLRAIYDPEELPEDFAPAPAGKDFAPVKGFGEAPLLSDKWWQELPSMKAQAVRYGVQGEVDSAREKLAPKNQQGDTVQISEKFSAEDRKLIEEIITPLSEEYKTYLTTIEPGAEKAAGDVNIGGRMRVSARKPETVIHEFAHSISTTTRTKLGLADDSEFWKELRKIRTQYMKDVGSDTSRWISFYEHSNVKNINEFMAEAFTQVKLKEMGFKIPDHYGKDFTYSRQVVNLIDKYFKRAEPGKIIFHSEKTRELLNKQKPVDPVILNKVKINLNAQGYDVRQDQATDEYLESRGKEAQIIASNEKTLVCLHTKLSASGLFEELVHLNQIKKMKEYSIKHNDTDVIENEIKAKEKVLKHRKSYNITEDEVAFLEKSINQYRRELNEIRNKN